ncbi:four helix bundle protein [Flavobacterium cucumis]|uniref:Four helix bundle protein n=2 Tax=Flavobacterium cucumis TaxID=416016 RepID=A0A1M7ZT90_9FLAO|nr:four helix bundle protein [Flavobacterium cucumis]
MEDGSWKFYFVLKDIFMSFKFEKLIIWQNAMSFGEDIFKISQNFPKSETYNLTSQINRAVDSIALNISEGSIEQSNPEFRRFLGYAIRSLAEVVTCLHKAKRRAYISEVDFDKYYQDSYNLMNMMIAFRNKLS